jgi:hypothetical protein
MGKSILIGVFFYCWEMEFVLAKDIGRRRMSKSWTGGFGGGVELLLVILSA